MILDAFGARKHSVADLVTPLAVVYLALVTWSYLADASSVPPWKSYTSVALTVLFALAALNRRSHWAASIRALTGGWMIAAPFLPRFHDITPVLWAYLGIGAVLMTVSMPGVVALVCVGLPWGFSWRSAAGGTGFPLDDGGMTPGGGAMCSQSVTAIMAGCDN